MGQRAKKIYLAVRRDEEVVPTPPLATNRSARGVSRSGGQIASSDGIW